MIIEIEAIYLKKCGLYEVKMFEQVDFFWVRN